MANGRQETSASDSVYDLVSVLYHCLQGAETYEIYAADADEAGDEELSKFFEEITQEERRRADRAKALLTQRLTQS